MKADEEILRKKAMYEFKLMEWRDACRVLQEHITKAKYDNQIELARKREELEDDYEAQLNKLTANARQDAHLSKYLSVTLTLNCFQISVILRLPHMLRINH